AQSPRVLSRPRGAAPARARPGRGGGTPPHRPRAARRGRAQRQRHRDPGRRGARVGQLQHGGARDDRTECAGYARGAEQAAGCPAQEETGAHRAPQPTLDDIETLLKPAREAGLRATLKVTGEKRRLSAALDLWAYRIIQEAITNALKHANASRVEVIVNYRPDVVAVTISDNGAGPGPQNGGPNGHGLAGLRARVALFGGDLSTGTSALGGFTVRATLPVKT